MLNYLKIIAASVLALASPAIADDSAAPLKPALERLANAGSAEAFYHLGMMHHLGQGFPVDEKKAFELFRQGAEGGNPLAAYKLGCFYDGQGAGVVESDPEKALRYKMIAAEAGYSLAQHDVGKIYFDRGDYVQALRWLNAAASQGFDQSLFALASVYNGAEGIEKDAAITYAYFTLAKLMAGQGMSEAARKWRDDFAANMSAADRTRAEALIAGWRPAPTPLTLYALRGSKSAEAFVRAQSK